MSAGRIPPTLEWTGNALRIIDQRAIPNRLVLLDLSTCHYVAVAITEMAVRGAPAIGCAAAFGVAMAVRESASLEPQARSRYIRHAADALRSTRPTAVNLFWAIDRVLAQASRHADDPDAAADACLALAQEILADDLRCNLEIGRIGAEALPVGCSVLTHCNAGALATAGHGTALGIIRTAHQAGKLEHVYADETRPRLQGMLLTAWELSRDGIPVTVIADGAAAALMKSGKVDCVIVGADRIAANGDVANKVGTYALAIAASHHGVPFMVAAPVSTMDWGTPDGDAITIEERSEDEVTCIAGRRLAPDGVGAWNPSFDVTPAALITEIVTEHGRVQPSAAALRELKARIERSRT